MTDFNPKLPGDPEKLIRLALSDLLLVMNMSHKYRVDMSYYHAQTYGTYDGSEGPDSELKCTVCLAGASLARTIQDPDERVVNVQRLPIPTAQIKRLLFLDYIARAGRSWDYLTRPEDVEPHLNATFVEVENFFTYARTTYAAYEPKNPYPFIRYVLNCAAWWHGD